MSYNPQKIVVAVATATILTLSLGACGHTDSPATPAPAPADVPDCDLGDLREGDKDCKNVKAYGEAVRKYGKKKVEDAQRSYVESERQKADKKIKDLRDKAKSKTPSRPTIPGFNRTPQSQGQPTKDPRVISPFKVRSKRR